jgi:hypothetical protein
MQRLVMTGIILFLICGGGWFYAGNQVRQVRADDGTGDQPQRKSTITVKYTQTIWWMVQWSSNQILCQLPVEHDGVPTYNEIEGLCGKPLATQWLTTQPCDLSVTQASQCTGFYFHQVGTKEGERQIEIILPVPNVWIKLSDCNPLPGDRRCTTLPNLILSGEEPLPNETITDIQGTINGEPFTCQGSACRLPLPPTGNEGVNIEFWGDSSFGDATPHYTAKVRLVPWGDFMDPENKSTDQNAWYVDVLSSQWRDGTIASCSDTWQVFPDVKGPPGWLSSPDSIDGLKSDVDYYFLAGALIQGGIVNPTECLDGGLQSATVASACGVDAARPYLAEWQNRFDEQILLASKETGIPARLLKNVFARESQVWPGIFTSYKEAGLGQMTEQGADTVLLWNPDFFHQFCPLVLGKAYCDLGFGNLNAPEQNLLRGALVKQVNAACANCASGIDLSQANFSVRIFAEGLHANCVQVGRILQNLTGLDAGQSSSYEDLWRFTLVNYNAGPGCLSNAFKAARSAGDPVDWIHVTSKLDPACQGSIGYVEDISGMLKVAATPTPFLGLAGPTALPPRVKTLQPGEAPLATPLPTGTSLPSPTPTATSLTPTVTPSASPTPTGTP